MVILYNPPALGERITPRFKETASARPGTSTILDLLQDIVEEIVGEIKNDSIIGQKEYYKFPANNYFVLGSMQIDDFNETFNITLPESEEYNTIAGFIAERSGKILGINEVVEFEGVKFELIKKIRQKMVQFKIYSDEIDFKEKEGGSKE